MPQSILTYTHKHALLKPGDRVGVAVSGGADSVALLRILLELRGELGIVLSVVHLNHKLRGAESDGDEHFVSELAHQHGLELHNESRDVSAYARHKKRSLETAAREVRYQFFRRLLEEGKLDRIATGHTLDDQAETVLLRIARGAGTRGVAGIFPQLQVPLEKPRRSSQGSVVRRQATIIRPLLSTRRRDLETYLRGLGQTWCEDSSNRDLRHARNRVRHGILPRMERNLNPAIREALADTAEIARAEEEYWQQQVEAILPGKQALKIAVLKNLPLALQRRAIRAAAGACGLRLEFRHVEDVLAFALDHAGTGALTVLPNRWSAALSLGELHFEPATPPPACEYDYCLLVPGSIEVPELKSRFEIVEVSGTGTKEYNPDQLLDRERLGNQLHLRNWHAGDRFWPAHSKGPKKIKELLQQRHLTGDERKLWPLLASETEVVWVRGFPAASNLLARNMTAAWVVRETALDC